MRTLLLLLAVASMAVVATPSAMALHNSPIFCQITEPPFPIQDFIIGYLTTCVLPCLLSPVICVTD